MPKPVVAFVINSIGAGGAERALCNILSAIGERRARYDVRLILLDDEPDMRVMPDGLTRHVLNGRRSLARSLWALTACLRRLRPALVVSLLVRANLCTAVAARLSGSPSILCERMHLGSHLDGRYRGWRRWIVKALPKWLYPLATRVLGVSTGVTRNLIEEFGVDPKRTATIFNPFDLVRIAADAALPPPFPLPDDFIVAVGRLDPAKDFRGLIDAYLESGLPQSLVILGDGEERPALEARIAEAGAGERIHMPGYAANPFAVMGRARFYVSASLNEGFPNAMVEAMALGLPVVATDCRSGPAEILAGVERMGRQEVVQAPYGMIVPERSVAFMAEALRLMADPGTQARYAVQSLRRAGDFSIETVAEQYWRAFEDAMA